MIRPPYFKAARPFPDGTPPPPPLAFAVEREVRFEEVDAMGIVWHGRYPSYLEDARVAFGKRFGIGYDRLIAEQTPAPIKQMYINYIAPLRFGTLCRITARLHWSASARMNMSYALHDSAGLLCADGFTVQLFTTMDGELLLEQPDFYAAFCQKWIAGELR